MNAIYSSTYNRTNRIMGKGMFKTKAVSALALLFAFFATTAHAFFDAPSISPAHPDGGDEVTMSIRGGECDVLIGIPGYPQITRVGNTIHMLMASAHYASPELCHYGVGTAHYSIGSYTVGSYTLQVDRFYYNGNGERIVETLGIVPFVVGNIVATPVPTPTLNSAGFVALGSSLILIVALVFRSRRILVLLLLTAFVPHFARAEDAQFPRRYIEVLISSSPGAPSSKDLVDYYARPHGAPPLPTLAETNPTRVEYLLSNRASGDFLARLAANPESERAKLERTARAPDPPRHGRQ